MSATFTFVFVEMGQGDCCMVRCPDGKVIIVDCGSVENALGDTKPFFKAQELLRTPNWAGGQGNEIEALILTHPDADHHNKVVALCQEWNWPANTPLPSGETRTTATTLSRIDIPTIYFSDAAYQTPMLTGTLPLANYTGGGLNLNIYSKHFGTEELYEITINAAHGENPHFTRWKAGTDFKTIDNTFLIANNKYAVHSGTTDGEAWSVNIIAGNVPKTEKNDKASPDNAKSLITAFEVGGRCALLTGDATFSTERFLRDTHAALLSRVRLAQVPHHGSEHASHADTVAAFTNVERAVVSVSFMEHKHCHPRYSSVEPWLDRVGTAAGEVDHHIDYWTVGDQDAATLLGKWTTDGANVQGAGSFRFLDPPIDDYFGYKKEFGKDKFIYREFMDGRLHMTSHGTQVYKLTSTGVTRKP